MKKKLLFLLLSMMLGHAVCYANTPELVYSTFLGSSGWEFGHAVAVDSFGCAYISGQANSFGYPTTSGAFDVSYNGNPDVVVSKLSSDGSSMLYSTFIGGSERDDVRNVFVDQSGSVYISGSTTSADFPQTDNAIRDTSGVFILKLNTEGSDLNYCGRYVYGETGIVDHDGNLIFIGSTSSADFETTDDAYSGSLAGGSDAYLIKFDMRTNTIIFATLFGGINNETAYQVAVDQANNIITSGVTKSEDFPVTGEAFCDFAPGKDNVFITKFDPNGTEILFSTVIGGSNDDSPWGMAIDDIANVYITGRTGSSNFPTSQNAIKKTMDLRDGFLVKFNMDESRLVYSTFIGGTGNDDCRAVVADNDGKAYLTGCTHSTDFPVTQDAYINSFQGGGSDDWAWGDVFLLVLNASGDEIEYATFLGGRGDDEAYGIARNGCEILLCGTTPSPDFPTTEHAFDKSFNRGTDVYVTKFNFNNAVEVKSENSVPADFQLYQNYPNPFNPLTYIPYTLHKLSHVQLSIHNMLGQVISTPVNTVQNTGDYAVMWNGTDQNGNRVSSGIYFCQLSANHVKIRKKMLFLQ